MKIIITRRLFFLSIIFSIIILSLLSISHSQFIFSRKLRKAPEYEPKEIVNEKSNTDNKNNNENNILNNNNIDSQEILIVKKLIENSKFLNEMNLDGLTESKKLLATVHQSLYPWLYGYHYKSFSDLIQSYEGRGIVVCTGDYHFKYTRSTIDILRNIINCTLPIEVFYNGYNDLSRENQDILREFDNVYVTDISEYYNNDIVNATGWAIKPYAILASRFEEVILIDADVVYIRDPVELFEEKGYIDKGTLFFRDRSLLLGENNGTIWLKQWMIDPLPETKELRFWKEESYHEMESSTVVIHKTKTLLGLLNT